MASKCLLRLAVRSGLKTTTRLPAVPYGKKSSLKTLFIRFQAAFLCAKIKI